MDELSLPFEAVAQAMRAAKKEIEALEALLEHVRKTNRFESATRGNGPTNAIVALLRQRPRQIGEIVDFLENRVYTNANDRRKTLYTTIGTLKRSERIKEREDGLLTIA